jgi:hypothetical protein
VAILSEHREDVELLFTWPLLKDILPICDCIVSGSRLQITARVAQPHSLPSFAAAKRKMFLSATLLDDSQMTRELGVSVDNILLQIRPDEFDDLGERLILIPASLDQELGTTFASRVATGSTKLNRVVLVPSTKDAERWQALGATPVAAENIEAAIAPLRTSAGAFLALISKYDGIDLPDAACRLLVLDGLPRAATLSDWYLQTVLEGTPTLKSKIAQKIEQGLGRATRGKSDYCSNDLVSFVRNKQNRSHLSAGADAQLELGMAICKEIRESSERDAYPSHLIDEINRCLRRDEEWKVAYRAFIESYREQRAKREPDKEDLNAAAGEYKAARLFLNKDYVGCEAETKKLIERAGLSASEKGWFMQLSSAYQYPRDKSRALSTQKKAYELNSYLLIPPEGVQYHRMADRIETQARFGATVSATVR